MGSMLETERDFYTLDEVAMLFGVPVDTVLAWTRSGLPHSVKGGRWVFVKENVIEWAKTHRPRPRHD
ncbi:MAG: helix-turn-helix domain-containing protein [Chitinophagales bacterium]